MDLNVLNEKFKNCSCGKAHSCPIDYIEIGKGAVKALANVCEKYHRILLVSDNNTHPLCGKAIEEILGDKIAEQIILAPRGDVVIPNEETIAEIEEKLSSETDFIIGIGSGVINDLCKYVSAKLPRARRLF